MPIVRICHNRENPYVQLNKEALWDPNLSHKAVGLWAKCMSRTDDWAFHVSELASKSKDGEEAIYGQIKELIANRYVIRLKFNKQDAKGQFLKPKVEYVFFEFKLTEEEVEIQTNLIIQMNEAEGYKYVPDPDRQNTGPGVEDPKKEETSPNRQNPDPGKTELINNKNSKDRDNLYCEPNEPKEKDKPKKQAAAGNIKVYSFLEKISDLSLSQKKKLSAYPEEILKKAIRYIYHPTTRVEGGQIGRLKYIYYYLKNWEHFEEALNNLDKPSTNKENPDLALGKFKRGGIYNGYEFLRDDAGVGFIKPGMIQAYYIKWGPKIEFDQQFIDLLKKLGIDY